MKIDKFSEFSLPRFQIFGSENSKDYDIIVFVDSISQNIDLCSSICKDYDDKISKILTDKPINVNLGVIEDGYVSDVFKGTYDEVNNALYYTYELHDQIHDNLILGPIERDLNLKIIRSTRGILSFFSRTDLRSEIKLSLKGDIRSRLDILKKIDFQKMLDFPGKRESKSDIYKVLAFLYGQLFSLIDGYEKDSYTKNGIMRSYPELSNLINRNDITQQDLKILNLFNNRLIRLIESRIEEIGSIKEV